MYKIFCNTVIMIDKIKYGTKFENWSIVILLIIFLFNKINKEKIN